MNKIDKILNEAKNQNTPEFPFTNEEIRNFIKVDDTGEIPSNPKYKGIIKMTIVSSAITAIIALFMILSNSNENPVHTVAKVESIKSAIENVQNKIANPINSLSDSDNNLLTNAPNSGNSQSIANNNNSDEANKTFDDNTPTSDVQNNTDNSTDNNQIRNNDAPNTDESKQDIPDLAQASPKPNQEVEKPQPSPVIPKRDLRITMPEIDNEYLDSLEILILSDDELANISVIKTPCGYAFQAEELYPKSSSNINSKKNREAMGYPDKGIARVLNRIGKKLEDVELLPYTNWDMKKTLGIYPLSAWHNYKQGSSSSAMSTSFGFTPLADDMIAFVNENDDFRSALMDSISNNYQKDLNKINSIKIYYDRDKYETFKSIIPVIMSAKNDSLTTISTLFYPASTNIIKLLPKRYNLKADDEAFEYLTVGGDIEKVKNEFQAALNTSENICKTAEPKKEKKPAPPIAGIEELILREEELKMIGLNYIDNTYKFNMMDTENIEETPLPDRAKEMLTNLGYDINQKVLQLKARLIFNANYPDKDRITANDFSLAHNDSINYIDTNIILLSSSSYIKILKDSIFDNINNVPKAVLEDKNSYFEKYIFTNEYLNIEKIKELGIGNFDELGDMFTIDSIGKYRPRISNILPIKITLHGMMQGTKPTITDHYLWFYIDKNFAMKLPERYRTPILRELEIMEQIKRGELPPEMACEALKGEKSYLGICTANNPEIKNLQVFPNPVTDKKINVKFTLDKKTKLTIALYKPNGEFVSYLTGANKEYIADNYWITVRDPKLENGVYMLSIADDNGNRAIRKIIVQN